MSDQTKPALPTLAEIEAMEVLLGRATPGPWNVSERGGGLSWDISDASDQCLHDGYRGGFDREADADSIVALRNAAPSLLAAAREAVRLREELARVRADLDKAENAGLTAAMFALREAPWNPSAAVGMVRLVSVNPLKTEPVVLRREQVVGLFEALERAAAPLLTGKFRTAYEAVRRYEEHEGLVAERDAALRELARVKEREELARKGGAGA